MLNEVREQPEGVRFLKRVVGGQLTSPLLLVGEEGVGRRFAVTEAAREAFSEGDPESIHSVQLNQSVHPDFVVVKPEVASKGIGVEAVRRVIDLAYSFPAQVPTRYIMLDGVDSMSPAAANALLKTLEEPPKTTRFFLLAENYSKVIPTIRSRCGYVRFRPLSESFIVEHLSRIEKDATKALVYARLAEGSVGRATQYRLTGRLGLRNKMLGLLKLGLGRNLSPLFSAVDDLEKDLDLGLRFLEHLLHDLTMIDLVPDRLTNLDIVEELKVVAGQIGDRRLIRLTQGLRQIRSRMWTKITLTFHAKAYLAAVFAE